MFTERGRSALLTAAIAVASIGHVWLFRQGQSPILLLLSFAMLCLLISLRMTPTAAAVPSPHAVVCYASARTPSALSRTQAKTPRNAFTIDLEDYFHTQVASRSIAQEAWNTMPARVETSTHRLLDMLDQHGVTATVFVLGWVADRHPALVREVAARGHEIACHSYAHRLVYRMGQDEFWQDTVRAKHSIEDVSGARVCGYRAPSFSITPGTEWAFDTLASLGFTYDSSVNPIWHTTYAQPDAPRHPYRLAPSGLLELPIATCSFARLRAPIGGGAYLRLLPYWYLRGGLALVNSVERKPATLYVHPWEIDAYSPLVPKEWKSRVRQTWGTATMESKLARLLGSTPFGPIREVYGSCLAGEDAAARSKEHAESAMAAAL